MKQTRCRVCGGLLAPVLSFGRMPAPNVFRTDSGAGASYPLDLVVCGTCTLVQLGYIVPPRTLFTRYRFETGASQPLVDHLTRLAQTILSRSGRAHGTRILDIGCNDGTLLAACRDLGADVLGIEPAADACRRARSRGIAVENGFFGRTFAEGIARKYGTFDVVTATRVLANVADLNGFLAGIRRVLADGGILVLEVSAFDDLAEQGAFDAVYLEHYAYFTPESLGYLLRRNGFRIVLEQRTDFQGGELRVIAVPHGGQAAVPAANLIDYGAFTRRVLSYRKRVRALFDSLSAYSVAAWGVPAKGVTFLNYCGLDERQVRFAVDTTPAKAGSFVPGTSIPVYPEAGDVLAGAQYHLLLAWNYRDEIMKKRVSYGLTGIPLIVPFPDVRVVY